MIFESIPAIGFARERGRKKDFGHSRFGGEEAWKQHERRHLDGWEAEGRKAKQIRRMPAMVDATEALAEARAEIRNREAMDLFASQTVVAASYDLRNGLRVYSKPPQPSVKVIAAPVAATAPKAKRRHRGGRKHRNNRQRFAIAA